MCHTPMYRVLDLFCGAGGAAVGLKRAWPDACIVGVDNRRQPHYPFEFVLADAMHPPFDLREFDFIWASPPCQAYSVETPPKHRAKHSDLIARVRSMLQSCGVPYVIENVSNARRLLINPIMLCGSMFGLRVWRHRYFESPQLATLTPTCNHSELPVLLTGTTRRSPKNGGRFEYNVQECREASGLHWMTRKEMDEAIPPAYSEFIARQIRR